MWVWSSQFRNYCSLSHRPLEEYRKRAFMGQFENLASGGGSCVAARVPGGCASLTARLGLIALYNGGQNASNYVVMQIASAQELGIRLKRESPTLTLRSLQFWHPMRDFRCGLRCRLKPFPHLGVSVSIVYERRKGSRRSIVSGTSFAPIARVLYGFSGVNRPSVLVKNTLSVLELGRYLQT
jgi:hypothetical protein